MKNNNIKDKIIFYKTTLSLLIIFLTIFLIGATFIIIHWYKKAQMPKAPEAVSSGLLKADFESLEQSLREQSIPVESKMEIMYGKDIGKIEPFQISNE